jgi:hypothetical protein
MHAAVCSQRGTSSNRSGTSSRACPSLRSGTLHATLQASLGGTLALCYEVQMRQVHLLQLAAAAAAVLQGSVTNAQGAFGDHSILLSPFYTAAQQPTASLASPQISSSSSTCSAAAHSKPRLPCSTGGAAAVGAGPACGGAESCSG